MELVYYLGGVAFTLWGVGVGVLALAQLNVKNINSMSGYNYLL